MKARRAAVQFQRGALMAFLQEQSAQLEKVENERVMVAGERDAPLKRLTAFQPGGEEFKAALAIYF